MPALPTLRQLQYLVTVAETHHFGKAAEACFVTQSTLSAGLQELEAILGATLVERTRRRVFFTPLGKEVVARARVMLRDAEDIVDLARSSQEPLSGTLRLGVIPTIAPYLLPRALPHLRSAHPRLKLHLREDITARLINGLDEGSIDVALLALPYRAEVKTLVLAEDPFVFACPADHPLAERNAVTTADLDRADLLLLEEGHCLRDHALSACRLQPRGAGALMATSLTTLVQMVANGLGVTLLPRLAVDAGVLDGTDLVTRPLAEPAVRHIGLAWRPSSPRGDEFAILGDRLRQAVGSIDPIDQ